MAGSLQYPTEAIPTATDNSTVTTTNILIAVIVAVIVLILSIIVMIICVVRKKSRKQTRLAITGSNVDISMYASPAYGTHQVFTEPGLDHLYDRIDESYREKSTALQDPPQAEDYETPIDIKINPSVVDPTVTEETDVVDQEETTDVDDYIKMNSSCKVADQLVSEETESDVDDYMLMDLSPKPVDQSATDHDEYIQPAGDEDLLPTGNDNQ